MTVLMDVSIVLEGLSGSAAYEELDRKMSEIGFNKTVVSYRGMTEKTPSDLEAYILSEILTELVYADGGSVKATVIHKLGV